LRYYSSVTPTEAKASLIHQILIQADRENIPLSAVEREMLEFSEAENTPPNWQQLNAEFDRDYDQDIYEEKMASLICNRLADLKSIDSLELDQWHKAVAALAEEDHYLQVMIARAEHPGHRIQINTSRPPHDRLKLVATAAAFVIAVMIAIFSGIFDGCRPREQATPRPAASPASTTKPPVVSAPVRVQ
jgi:hypothetical protein